MARPIKQTVDYFPHIANASNEDTLTVLQSRFGNDGYAFWFKLLEKLASTDGHYLDCRTTLKWQLLLAKTGVTELIGTEIMLLLVEMKAVDKELWDSKLIWCQNLVNNLTDVYKNRKAELPVKPVLNHHNSITNTDNLIANTDNTQSKVKESKGKKIIVPAQNELADFDTFWKVYPKRKSKGDAERAFKKINPNKKLLQIIITAIERAKKSDDWLKENGQYIPYPATWLNAKGWEDEIKEGGSDGKNKGYHQQRRLPKVYKTPEQHFGAKDA